jgi:hypothetical protein
MPVCWRAERAITHPLLRGRSLVLASGESRSGCPAYRRRQVFWWAVRLCGARCTLWSCPPFCPGGVLMDADKRGIDHGVCIVSSSSEMCENPLPDAAFRPAAVAAVHILPIAKPCGQSAPRNACPVAVKHCLHKEAVVFGRSSNRLCPTRQHMRALLPLIVPPSIASHHLYAPPAAYKQ